jgi:hypothetical protein
MSAVYQCNSCKKANKSGKGKGGKFYAHVSFSSYHCYYISGCSLLFYFILLQDPKLRKLVPHLSTWQPFDLPSTGGYSDELIMTVIGSNFEPRSLRATRDLFDHVYARRVKRYMGRVGGLATRLKLHGQAKARFLSRFNFPPTEVPDRPTIEGMKDAGKERYRSISGRIQDKLQSQPCHDVGKKVYL